MDQRIKTNMKELYFSILLGFFLFTISFNSAFAQTEENILMNSSASGQSHGIFGIQLAENDAQTCQVNCSEQLERCKKSAYSVSKDDNERRKGEQECDLNYRACVSSCK